MSAKLLFRQKLTDSAGDLTEWVVWQVPISEKYPDGVRYRMVYIPDGHEKPAVLYDNHHPKGPHRHVDRKETTYHFMTVEKLLEDFGKDVFLWQEKKR